MVGHESEKVATRPGKHRKVPVGSNSLFLTDLVMPTGPGIGRKLVSRHIQNPGVAIEHLLGGIPMVDVPVHNRDPLAVIGQVDGRNRNVVEKTEAHRSIPLGVVAWGPNRQESGVTITRHQTLGCIDAGPRCPEGCFPRCRHNACVRVEHPSSGGTQTLDAPNVFWVVNPFEIGSFRLWRHHRSNIEPGTFDAGLDGFEPFWTFRMDLGVPVTRETRIDVVKQPHRNTLAQLLALCPGRSQPNSRPRQTCGVRYDYSAGGIVRDEQGNVAIIRTTNLKGDVVWGLPKGHPSKGEKAKEAAKREAQEETGLVLEVDDDLPAASVEYWFVDKQGERVKKQVDFWLMRAIGGDISDHDHEVDEVAILAPADAIKRLSYPNEKKALSSALGVK